MGTRALPKQNPGPGGSEEVRHRLGRTGDTRLQVGRRLLSWIWAKESCAGAHSLIASLKQRLW